jgi:hypothetical protein
MLQRLVGLVTRVRDREQERAWGALELHGPSDPAPGFDMSNDGETTTNEEITAHYQVLPRQRRGPEVEVQSEPLALSVRELKGRKYVVGNRPAEVNLRESLAEASSLR